MTKLITIPKFAQATGLPYRLCLHLVGTGQIPSVPVGRRRRIVLSTPHFLVVPHLLLETPLIATMHSRAARWLGGAFNLETSPVPTAVSRFQESMVWHEVVDRDPAQLWLRQTILDLAHGL